MTDLRPYIDMISAFVEGPMPAEEFMLRYLQYFKDDPSDLAEKEYRILDRLFADADFFEPNPDLRTEDSLDEPQFRAAAASALERLRKLQPPN